MQRSRRLRRGVILGVVVVVAAWGVVVGVRLARADGRLRSGIALARAARAEVSPGDLTGGPAARTLAAARADFDAAHADVTGALVAPLTVIPVVDTQIRSIADLSSAAATVSQAGDHALAAAGGLLARPHGSPAQRVVILRSLASTLHGLRSTLARLDLGPRHGLLSALVSKRDTFAGDVAKLRAAVDRADGASAAAAALLGHDATYLLLAANNAEMRAGSGMALEVGTLTVRHGEIDLGALQPSSALVDTRTSLRAGGDIEARWGFEHPTFDFRDLLFSPQFAPNAALAARMWTARTGQRVSGVLLVDDTVVPDLLSVVGPVTAAGHTLDAADALRYLLIGQYAGLSTTDPGRAARHELLGALAGAAFQQATAPGTSLTGLAKVLDGAADGRH
ncbi:MAG TPA: DUF4012 domain-containing protein, partial [Acidimicrobiales bacterium]|nr:DUF4012 domain-containing protein [Acidimicrobiales bacterium]